MYLNTVTLDMVDALRQLAAETGVVPTFLRFPQMKKGNIKMILCQVSIHGAALPLLLWTVSV